MIGLAEMEGRICKHPKWYARHLGFFEWLFSNRCSGCQAEHKCRAQRWHSKDRVFIAADRLSYSLDRAAYNPAWLDDMLR